MIQSFHGRRFISFHWKSTWPGWSPISDTFWCSWPNNNERTRGETDSDTDSDWLLTPQVGLFADVIPEQIQLTLPFQIGELLLDFAERGERILLGRFHDLISDCLLDRLVDRLFQLVVRGEIACSDERTEDVEVFGTQDCRQKCVTLLLAVSVVLHGRLPQLDLVRSPQKIV